MKTYIEPQTTVQLSTQEMENIYRIQQRLYWEIDFISRCEERKQEETGLCNLPYKTLPDEKKLLNLAYELYNNKEDSNTAYNVTLDLVIDEIEHWIRDKQIGDTTKEDGKNPRVVVVMEDGIITTVFSTEPDIRVNITDLDRNYANTDLRSAAFDALIYNPDLQICDYSTYIPGYEQEMETEVDE